MSTRNKSTAGSTTGSSSSSSGSSNSSSSSSGSSGSSSSDSDSSSSQDSKTAQTSKNNLNANSNSNQTKQNDKSVRRRSSETSSSTAKGQSNSNDKNGQINNKTIKDKNAVVVSKPSQTKVVKNVTVYSSDDDGVPSKNSSAAKLASQTEAAINKKKSQAAVFKPMKSNSGQSNQGPPINTGGKAPPSVVKQAKLINSKLAANQIKATVEKSSSSSSTGNSSSSKQDKQKSIFSPDNSTDSDDDAPQSHKPHKNISVTKAISGSVKSSQIRNQVKGKETNAGARPKQKVAEKEKILQKSSAESSATSSSSSNSSSSSDSDSNSDTGDDSPPQKIKSSQSRKSIQKSQSNTTKTTDTSKNNSDSDNINDSSKPNVVRKLTRSASTRKSQFITRKAAASETTDSDAESVINSKRSLSKSPVKKAPNVTKGKAKNKRIDTKTADSNVKTTPPTPEERKCPLDDCDSLGHLSGAHDKHFTIEACPMYHNLTIVQTKEHYQERKKREDDRKKLVQILSNINADPVKKHNQNIEQKMYLQKIKEIRMKFKPIPSPTTIDKNAILNSDKEKEPILAGHVSEYDLQLFREAQAVASENIENELKGLPASRGTKYILLGKFCMEVWYQSPYPADAARLPKLYICEFCLRYQKSEVGMKRHSAKCVWRHPPGDEIYRDRKGKLGVWQVDGKRHKQYCQHLCLLAKFFLDHKTLYYDVEPFLFYVMTLADSDGCHTVGYFSKEKNSFLNYNVSCILTLPPYQRKGYGRLLIDFSYLLTRVEGKIGSPEKPLSDLGLISYRSYWKDVLLDYLCSRSGTALSIKDVSQEMAINSYDIVSTLQALGMMKYWKGKHIILKKQDVLEEYAERVKQRGAVIKIDPACLRWTPFVPPAQTGPS